MKIIAVDYKGKWFVLTDADRRDDMDFERPEINIEYVTTYGLRGHVENCRFYGIPAYVGNNKFLSDQIEKLTEEMDKRDDAIIKEGMTGETEGKA